VFVGPIINHVILDQQSTFFKLTMLNHCQDAMLPQNDVNSTTQLWERIVLSRILNQILSKWFKTAKLCNFLMLGNVEDECNIHVDKVPKLVDYTFGHCCLHVCS
jgi:hypothetical protein